MSEFQYHEWQTIDRLLTTAEQTAVNRLSSHITVTSSRAEVTYHWSSFRHDPVEVMLKYFDAYLYLADWGSLTLMFRFPKDLLDEDVVDRYCDGEYASFYTAGEYQVLAIDIDPEGYGGIEVDLTVTLSDFVQLRSDLVEGDYRLLYLAWLVSMPFSAEGEGVEDDEITERFGFEPPVPPGLKRLTPALHAFASAFQIDPFLIQAAAESSPDLRSPQSVDYRSLITHLSRGECDEYLFRLARGDAGVGASLRKRLGEFAPSQAIPGGQPRFIQQLRQRAQALKQAEQQRRAEAARRQHIAEMEALAKNEAQVWLQVDDLLQNGRRIASVYDEATGLLLKLSQLAEYQDRRSGFLSRLRQLAEKYAARPALIGRWEHHGWV
jgi:hypothetical protein